MEVSLGQGSPADPLRDPSDAAVLDVDDTTGTRSRRPTRADGQPPVTAYHQLAHKLRDDILSGRLDLGQQLPTESDLSSAYHVSRGTAREALRSLETQGLLVVKRGVSGGAFVSLPTPERIRDSLRTSLALLAKHSELTVDALVEVREILEVPGAELAALRHTKSDLMKIRNSLFDTEVMEPHEVYAKSQDFHNYIQRAAHNPMLDLLTEPIAVVTVERTGRTRDQAFWDQVDREHREILAHLIARDQVGAREAMRAHLRAVRPAYERIVKDRTAGKMAAD